MLYTHDFLKYLELERNYSPATVRHYGNDLELFSSFLESEGGPADPNLVTSEDVRSWMAQMMERGEKASSVCRRLSAIRSFFRFLQATRRTENDPTKKIQGPKREKVLPYFLKEREIDKLIDQDMAGCSFEQYCDHIIIEIFYATGIRLSELVGLNTNDIDLRERTVKVTGKRNKQRIIPFGEELEKDLEAYLHLRNALPFIEDNALIISEKGRRLSPERIRDHVKKQLSLVTTIKKRSPHVLRHTFATAVLNHNANIEVVKELLGHESIATTEIYTHITFEELKKVYNKAHPRS